MKKKFIAFLIVFAITIVTVVTVHFAFKEARYQFAINEDETITFAVPANASVKQSTDKKAYEISNEESSLYLEIYQIEEDQVEITEKNLPTLYGFLASDGIEKDKVENKIKLATLLDMNIYMSKTISGSQLLFELGRKLKSVVIKDSKYFIRGTLNLSEDNAELTPNLIYDVFID